MRTIATVTAVWIGFSFPLGILIGHWLKRQGAGYPEHGAVSWGPG